MQKLNYALVCAIVLLSAVLCEEYEEYVEVNCPMHWGGTVCDCKYAHEFMKLPLLSGNLRQIEIRNCEKFLVPGDSLRDLFQLNVLRFGNITELKILEYSLNSTRNRPSIRIEIENCTVPNLPQHFFKGILDEFVVKTSTISKIHMFALTGLFGEMLNFKILNSTIEQVDTQAFRKLSIQHLEIYNSTFLMNTVSRTFYDCHIGVIEIERSSFPMIMSYAFDAKEVERLRIVNSTFGIIESDAFVMDVSDRAIFNENAVEMLHRNAFKGITMNTNIPQLRTGNVYFVFDNNRVNFIAPVDDMSFCPRMQLQLSKLYLQDPQTCESVNEINERKFFNDNAQAIYMRLEDEVETFNSISYLSERCRDQSKWFMYLLIATAVVVFFAIMIPAICCYIRCRSNKRKKNLNLVMPEPRTYRQTQIVMQIENTGLIKTDF